jgi:exodeoxyribonuclease-3
VSTSSAQSEVSRRRREAALALRASMSPAAPGAGVLRVATWNVNSLRARATSIGRLIDRARPDVILLQETKRSAVHPDAQHMLDDRGYSIAHVGSGPYNGVAIAALVPLHDVLGSGRLDDDVLDREPRVISAVADHGGLGPIRFVSVYVPHGREVGHWHYEYKLAFLDSLRRRIGEWLRVGRVVVGGDINVAATKSDIFHPDAFVGLTHVTEPERDALAALLGTGLIDLDVARWGAHERRFTWWNHGLGYGRNLGMRIDVLAADAILAGQLETTWIDHSERSSERPSDHAALLADFRLDGP